MFVNLSCVEPHIYLNLQNIATKLMFFFVQSLVEETQRRFSTAAKENVKLDSLNNMENGFANNNKDSQSLVVSFFILKE